MRLPFSLDISAPLYDVLPVLALALFEADGVWSRQMLSHPTTWQWIEEQALGPTIIELHVGQETLSDCILRITGPHSEPDERLQHTINQIMAMLHEYKFKYELNSIAPPQGIALFIAPHEAPYTALAPLITQVVEKYDLSFVYPSTENMSSADLLELVQKASLVIGVWETLPGQSALYQSWIGEIPFLVLVREKAVAAKWLNPLIHYSQPVDILLMMLEQAVAQRLREPRSPDQENESEDDFGKRSSNLSPSDQIQLPELNTLDLNTLPLLPSTLPQNKHTHRRLIYREVALNQTLPLEQRLHAARVLSESEDSEVAAQALGSLLMHKEIGELAHHAFMLLGSLGKAAQPVLWYLDAQTAHPLRAIAIARQLARAGDVQTALFRLEQLAQHANEEIRFAALDTMAETGLLAKSHFQELAHYASDSKTRFKAVEWLHEQGSSVENLVMILKDLSWQTNQPDIARMSVEMLTRIGNESMIEATILRIAQGSPSLTARLAAAEELHQQGQAEKARSILLQLAQGDDHVTAGAALNKLVDLSDQAIDDAEQVMKNAYLEKIRCRAANILSHSDQPRAVQRAATRVFLTLNRPELAVPVLGRLVRSFTATSISTDTEITRWAAQQLVHIGKPALAEIRRSFAKIDDPVAGQYLAEGLLSLSKQVEDRQQAALWLARHSSLPRAIEVLRDLALSARLSGSMAVKITNDIGNYAVHWAGAARALARLVSDSPHPSVRARALDLLLRDYPSEVPLALLIDLAVTGSIGVADRSPIIEQLGVLARPAATSIATRLVDENIRTERRWQLLQLINELPQTAATQAYLQLSTNAPQNRIRYVAAEQLVARGLHEAGYAALSTIAINEPDRRLREMALYELVQGLPETAELIKSIIERTHYEDTFHLARDLFFGRKRSFLSSMNHWLDRFVMRWDTWVAALPLGWLDGVIKRTSPNRQK